MSGYRKQRIQHYLKPDRMTIASLLLLLIFTAFGSAALKPSADINAADTDATLSVSGNTGDGDIRLAPVRPDLQKPDSKKPEADQRGERTMISVPYIDQSSAYPSGCEIVSATMLLQYYGYSLSADTMIDRYLDKADITKENGIVYSGDPGKAFIGTPYSVYSYGCYAPVIVNSLDRVLKGGQKAVNTTGTDLPDLIKNYIDRGTPVLIWASVDMAETNLTPAWVNRDTGETEYWPSNEHCLVLVGYDKDYYYFNDPYHNRGVDRYQKDSVEKRFRELKLQSVVIVS